MNKTNQLWVTGNNRLRAENRAKYLLNRSGLVYRILDVSPGNMIDAWCVTWSAYKGEVL